MTHQLHKNIIQQLISRKLHSPYSFVIQRITWKNCLGIIFLGKSHFSYIKECFRNSCRNNFRLECKSKMGTLWGSRQLFLSYHGQKAIYYMSIANLFAWYRVYYRPHFGPPALNGNKNRKKI